MSLTLSMVSISFPQPFSIMSNTCRKHYSFSVYQKKQNVAMCLAFTRIRWQMGPSLPQNSLIKVCWIVFCYCNQFLWWSTRRGKGLGCLLASLRHFRPRNLVWSFWTYVGEPAEQNYLLILWFYSKRGGGEGWGLAFQGPLQRHSPSVPKACH